ncbi:MAG: hypothetical protein ABW106_05520 [Steroidobacteraceae bacterium]
MSNHSAVPETRILKLTDREIAMYLDIESISTITWYEGSAPIAFIQARVGEILALNPWLAGRFAKVHGRVNVMYSTSAAAPELPYFNVLKTDEVGEQAPKSRRNKPSPADKLDRIFAPYCVKTARQSVNKDEPLFRVTVVQRAPDRFALCMSLSHAIADGVTYYALLRMLSCDQRPRALIAERDLSKVDEILKHTGEDEKFLTSMGFVLNLIGTLMFLKKGSLFNRKLRPSGIAEQKETVQRQPRNGPVGSFVSTNDILTSLFFRKTNCDLGLMAINFRDRIGVSDDYVGNYESVLFYQRGDYETPELIRASLAEGRYRRAITGKILPSFIKRLTASFAAVSNVTSLYYPVAFEGCDELLHHFYWIPHQMPMHYGVLYKMNKNTPALLTMESWRTVDMDKLHEEGVVGDEIDIAQYC